MKIFQIWYDEHSKSKLSPHFIPYDNRTPDKPNEFEYGVMRKLYYDEKTWHNNNRLGVMSWKFHQKTNTPPLKFVNWIRSNKAEVHHINPFPTMSNKYYNVWSQGEAFHPGITNLAGQLFEKAGLSFELFRTEHKSNIACYCNYWVANKKFWDLYMSYTEPLYKVVYESDQETLDKLFNIKADVNINSGMFSFIFERMFSTVLATHTNEFKIMAYK